MYYVEEAKSSLLSIIDGIIEKCPGIDINLGFIGYRDFYAQHIDIDFTKNHSYVKNVISNVYASGGGFYIPEDVALALELALKKDWKSNAKFAVFVADAPYYGEQYGGIEIRYKPERRIIEEMIAEMAQKSISFFCLKITKETDIMYSLFEDIYNKIKSINTKFMIVDNSQSITPFSDIVIYNAVDVYNEKRRAKQKGCLMAEYTAINILKSTYGINNPSPDNNIRFLLGTCNPVLLIPGIFATKLMVELNCKGLATQERSTTLKDIRLFCGDTVCYNETKIREEHRLLFSIDDGPFSIKIGFIPTSDQYRACLGHILNYFQNENECTKVDGKNICYYSKYVKVSYYGGTTDTLKKSRCGVEGISNVIQGLNTWFDLFANSISAGASFYKISQELIHRGYKEGFSLGALPNDYRRYLSTNNFATNIFKNQIERLYKNTGKPVVIIAHSFGTLVTLTNLLLKQEDKVFLKKIKKFIAMAPPFAGSSKLLDVFLHGMKDFDTSNPIIKTNFNIFGQYLIYKSLPTVLELRPLPIAAKIFTDSEYSELGDAIRDILSIERDCQSTDCDVSEIKNKTSNYDKLFKGYFPSLLDSDCSYEPNYKGNEDVLYRKCYTGIYNVGECPTIITKSVNPNIFNIKREIYCKRYGAEYFYQGECNEQNKNCLDQIYYSEKTPYVYDNKEAINFLIDRFNKDFSKEYGNIDKNYFDSHKTIRKGLQNSIEYQKKIDLIKELPVPPVDTELLYASFNPTFASFILDDKNFTEEAVIYEKGGDGTVPTWSSLLTGLKWVYDKKKKNLPQKI